jgi:mono/diheme cytochrome c family protein
MRHLLASIVTLTIATLLFVGSALFAWMRTAQLVVADEATLLARFEPAPGHEFRWQELGPVGYERNCSNCHRPDGSGWDQYPPVTHAAALAEAPGGRDYLIDLHLHGLTSDRWGAPMPPMRHMRDVELAAVLNHLIAHFSGVGGAELLYVPEDIARRREPRRSPAEVNRDRPPVRVPDRR